MREYGVLKGKPEEHSRVHNKRNNDNISQVRVAIRPEFHRQTVKEKSSRNKKKIRKGTIRR